MTEPVPTRKADCGRIHVMADDPGLRSALDVAVTRGGGISVAETERPNGLIAAVGPADLAAALKRLPSVRWVQLGGAGIDAYAALLDPTILWTSAKGAYAAPVAEHALMLCLATLRHLTVRARASSWGTQAGRSLHGLHCVVVGGGGIGTELVRLLSVFDCSVTVVRRSPRPVLGAHRVVDRKGLQAVLPETDVLFLAAALTSETAGMIGAAQLAAMPRSAVVVNVGRGGLLDTDALTFALQMGQVAGAGLDVTSPEPLPASHPLWRDDRVLITPHTADTPEMIEVFLAARVEENVRRRIAQTSLEGVVSPELGY